MKKYVKEQYEHDNETRKAVEKEYNEQFHIALVSVFVGFAIAIVVCAINSVLS